MELTPVQLVRRLFDANRTGDDVLVLSLLAEDIEARAAADGREFHGIEDVRDWLVGAAHGGPRTEVDAELVEDLGSDVLVVGRLRAFHGGVMWDRPACWLFRVRDGRITRISGFRSPEHARAALSVHD
ncbi:MAG: nuclear transport factor 2 family protein [Solirubrobacterales bacterium]|nr:nuclear transport factor 2 family protein [Solirubrobacterales bacterium]